MPGKVYTPDESALVAVALSNFHLHLSDHMGLNGLDGMGCLLHYPDSTDGPVHFVLSVYGHQFHARGESHALVIDLIDPDSFVFRRLCAMIHGVWIGERCWRGTA